MSTSAVSKVAPSQINEILEQAKKKAFEETANEPEPKLTGEVKWPVTAEIGRGLENAVTNETKVGYVNGAKGWLNYRGYDVFNLSLYSTFEETSYALLFGAMPTVNQLADFKKKLAANRSIPSKIISIMKQYPILDTHPMISLSIGVSLLSTFDKTTETLTVEAETEVAIKLIAQMATLAAAVARIRAGKEPIEPDPSLSHAANFIYMLNGERPDKGAERVMDICLILHADHGMNASTFATMVTNSTLSDMYSSIVTGIGTLKGPLHGGANEQVVYQLEEIGSLENVEPWYRKAREAKKKVMGFGHRVYKSYDPRARILGPLVDVFTSDPEIKRLYDIANKLNNLVCAELGKEKKIFPNVDFYSGLVYKAMGIEIPMFSVIFAVSRISGWGGRVLEYLKDNRLFRPRAVYTGPMLAEYVPIEKR
jgi:citrate synthase